MEFSRKTGIELEGSDSEASSTFQIHDHHHNNHHNHDNHHKHDNHHYHDNHHHHHQASNTFKIPDVPKPNTGADDVTDWAAEVIMI